MPNILHRLTIDAPPERVREIAASNRGVEQWWTAHPVAGEDSVGGKLSVFFSDHDQAAAVFEVVERSQEKVVWRTVEGPRDWIDTRIIFALIPGPDGDTTLLFSHEGWREENEFMHGCSTNWGAYLRA